MIEDDQLKHTLLKMAMRSRAQRTTLVDMLKSFEDTYLRLKYLQTVPSTLGSTPLVALATDLSLPACRDPSAPPSATPELFSDPPDPRVCLGSNFYLFLILRLYKWSNITNPV